LKPALANSLRDPISKTANTKNTGGVAQGLECLPSKSEGLSSNSSTAERQRERNRDRERQRNY
jgi:hypothetical protein